jgi:DNA-binding beta-propeller fold protein YncE
VKGNFVWAAAILFFMTSCSSVPGSPGYKKSRYATAPFSSEVDFSKEARRGICEVPKAREFFDEGSASLQRLAKDDQESALESFQECLKIEPGCVSCLYESGWANWNLGVWPEVIKDWEKVLKVQPLHPGALHYLALAKQRDEEAQVRKKPPIQRVAIGTHSYPEAAPIQFDLEARFQSYYGKPAQSGDQYDEQIDSPKSARFDANGERVFVNSLEANKTLIYDANQFTKLGSVSHEFTAKDAGLFHEKNPPFGYEFDEGLTHGHPDIFTGKPVESELTHDGKYLWVPYYRRDYDGKGTNPSAVAIIDTSTNQIVRVMATGPISKYVLASPDGKFMAVSHWGDNTLLLIDIRKPDPADFKYVSHIVIDEVLALDTLKGVNRDKECGLCLRGLAYSKDSRFLFVARMGKKGGVAVIDLQAHGEPKYLGSFSGMPLKPRDILVSPDGRWLYISSTLAGYVSRIPVATVVESFTQPTKVPGALPPLLRPLKGFEKAFVGQGPRSIRLTPDGKYLFASVYGMSRVVAVETDRMKVVAAMAADPFPVGMAMSPKGDQLWITCQSHQGIGGNAVDVLKIRYAK